MPLGQEPTDEDVASFGLAGEASESPGPDLSSSTPDHSTDPHRDAPAELAEVMQQATDAADAEAEAEAQAPEDEGVVQPLNFPDESKLDFLGLCHIGALHREFEWLGHRFKIRTLTTNEILEVALLCQPYANTMAELRAYSAAVAAACVVSIDAKMLPQPIGLNDTPLSDRWRYILDNWYPTTLDRVYTEYLVLEQRVTQVVNAMGKVSTSQATSNPGSNTNFSQPNDAAS